MRLRCLQVHGRPMDVVGEKVRTPAELFGKPVDFVSQIGRNSKMSNDEGGPIEDSNLGYKVHVSSVHGTVRPAFQVNVFR